MKKFKVYWVDRVEYSVEIEAVSPEAALDIYNNSSEWLYKTEENVEYINEPYVEEEWNNMWFMETE